MIKGIFFDFDGVLTVDKTGSLTTTRYLSQATGIDQGRLKAAFDRQNRDLILGSRTHADVWPDICRDAGVELDVSLLEPAFLSTPLNGEMMDLARRLKPAFVLGIITDNKRDRMACIERRHRLSSLFDPVVVSAEVGASKSEHMIFERALALAHLAPRECIFIDNDARNLAIPRAMGMNVIHFDDDVNDVQRLIRQLRAHHVVAGGG